MNREQAIEIIFSDSHLAKAFYEEALTLMERENDFIGIERSADSVYVEKGHPTLSDQLTLLALDKKFVVSLPFVCRYTHL